MVKSFKKGLSYKKSDHALQLLLVAFDSIFSSKGTSLLILVRVQSDPILCPNDSSYRV